MRPLRELYHLRSSDLSEDWHATVGLEERTVAHPSVGALVVLN